MGAGNVKLAFALWGDLPHAPFRALTYMALVSLDDDRPPRYWGGREHLALALGRDVPARNDEDPGVTRERRAAFRAVDRVVADLTKAGAIETIEDARHYRNATYALRLWRRDRTTVSVDLQDHGERGAKDHGERGLQDHGERGARTTVSVAHRKSEEDQGLTSGEMGRGDLQRDPGAHAREPLRSMPTGGVRDPVPPGGGVPGQQPFLAPVAAPATPSTPQKPPRDPEAPHGRCEGCQRPLARNRPACLRCGLMIGEVS